MFHGQCVQFAVNLNLNAVAGLFPRTGNGKTETYKNTVLRMGENQLISQSRLLRFSQKRILIKAVMLFLSYTQICTYIAIVCLQNKGSNRGYRLNHNNRQVTVERLIRYHGSFKSRLKTSLIKQFFNTWRGRQFLEIKV